MQFFTVCIFTVCQKTEPSIIIMHKSFNLLSGNLTDKSGTEVFIMADLKSILEEVKTDPKWSNTKVGVASSCDEPSWARECIQKFNITKDLKLKDVFSPNLTEIYKGSKSGHLKEISGKSGVNLNEMIFFDNEWGKSKIFWSNCEMRIWRTDAGGRT